MTRSYDVDGVRVRHEVPRVRVEDAPAKRSQCDLDAMADARTLTESGVVDLNGDSFYVVAAGLMGTRCIAALEGRLQYTKGAWHEATMAARAAFRAVPALRGDVR